MGFLTTPLAFVVVLGIIIFVHEFGHLITAKAFGMRVFIFSFGFGKRLFGFQWGDTDCRVSAVPLGGYVKLEGEPGDHLSEDTSAPRRRPRLPLAPALAALPRLPGRARDERAAHDRRAHRLLHGRLRGRRQPLRPSDRRRGRRGLAGGEGRPRARRRDPVDRRQAPAVVGGRAVPHPAAARRGRSSCRCAAPAGEREVALRSEATTAERIGSIGVHPLVRVGAGAARTSRPRRRG